jgi:hypothetical protein
MDEPAAVLVPRALVVRALQIGVQEIVRPVTAAGGLVG